MNNEGLLLTDEELKTIGKEGRQSLFWMRKVAEAQLAKIQPFLRAEREKVRKEERERIIKWLSGHQVSDSAKGSNFELTCDDWVKLKGNVSTGQE